eukprot:1749046-Rhodomonas_salina.1
MTPIRYSESLEREYVLANPSGYTRTQAQPMPLLVLVIACTPECLHHVRDLERSRDGSQLFAVCMRVLYLIVQRAKLSTSESAGVHSDAAGQIPCPLRFSRQWHCTVTNLALQRKGQPPPRPLTGLADLSPPPTRRLALRWPWRGRAYAH